MHLNVLTLKNIEKVLKGPGYTQIVARSVGTWIQVLPQVLCLKYTQKIIFNYILYLKKYIYFLYIKYI